MEKQMSYSSDDLSDGGDHLLNGMEMDHIDGLMETVRIPSYEPCYTDMPGLHNIGEDDEIMV